MISRTDVDSFVTEAKEAIETDPQMNEAMTKNAILNPFCELLGWEFPQPGRVEYPVEAFSRQFRVDYAYIHDGTEQAFLEAKGVDTPLTDDERSQLKAYLKNGTAELGILSNGETYEFYQRITEPEIEVKQAAVVQLEQLPNQVRTLRPFTHEELSKGSSGEDGRGMLRWIQENELFEVLREHKSQIAADIGQTITEHTEPDVSGGEFEQPIRSSIDNAAKSTVDTLLSQIDNGNIGQDKNGDSNGSTPDENEYALDIFNPDTDTELFEITAAYQSDLMAAGVAYLIENESLIEQVSPLPYVPGKKRAILNTEPTHSDREMAGPREIADGYYLELNLSWEQKKRELRRMADMCDVGIKIQVRDSTES